MSVREAKKIKKAKRAKNMNIILIFVVCFVLGTCLTIQTKNSNSEHAFVSAKVIEDNKVTIAAEREEIERINVLISDTQQKLADYDSAGVTDWEIKSQVEKEYNEAKKAAGLTDIQGPGIKVFLDDGVRDLQEWEDSNDIIVHDLDLITLINELINAGAEAVSVNGERYLPTTEVSCSGSTVKINGRTYARPFRINAIGDETTLYAAMTVPGGYGSIISQYGLIFNVEKSDSIIIPAYKGSLVLDRIIKGEEEN